MTQKVEKAAAIVTIFDAADMTPAGRKNIASWLRSRAALLEEYPDQLSARFVSRYIYAPSLKAKARKK